jgi:hypothetical protein
LSATHLALHILTAINELREPDPSYVNRLRDLEPAWAHRELDELAGEVLLRALLNTNPHPLKAYARSWRKPKDTAPRRISSASRKDANKVEGSERVA